MGPAARVGVSTASHQSNRSASVLALQGAVGNDAVSRLLSGTAVQRRPAPGGAGDRPADPLLDEIRDLALEFPRVRSIPSERARVLGDLDALCTEWVNSHARSEVPGDLARRQTIMKLLDSVATLRRHQSQQDAEERYMRDMTSSKKAPSPTPFKAISSSAKMAKGQAPRRAAKAIEGAGISPAEAAAIVTYTAADYKYINPSVANSRSWLEAQQGSEGLEGMSGLLAEKRETKKSVGGRVASSVRKRLGLASKPPASSATSMSGGAKTVREEGSLHAAMAIKGLRKLPAVTKDTYRGTRISGAKFQADFSVGKVFTFAALGSSSWDRNVAVDFSHGLSGDSKPGPDQNVAVLTVITNSGGRDVSELSMVPEEKEVLILPGSSFVTTSVEEVDGRTLYRDQIARLTSGGLPVPNRWYVVRMEPAKSQRSP